MKEWMLKHPIMTFLLADTLITGVLKCIACFSPNYKVEEEEKEEKADPGILQINLKKNDSNEEETV